MITFLYTISTILGIVVISCSFIAFLLRRGIAPMTGMMGAMGIGMSVSLTMGVLLGGYFQESLITSTILSMAIGILTGISIGFPISILAVLDGILAGLMGGMMGAMLGVMLSINDTILLVKILLSITICISVICILLFIPIKKEEKPASFKWFLRPFATFCILLLLFIGIDHINVSSNEGTQDHSSHLGGKTDTKIVEIVTSGLSYSPSHVTLMKEEALKLQLINNDKVEHDIEIVHFPHTIIESEQHDHTAGHAHQNSNSTIHLHAQPKSSSSLTFTPLKKGNYEFYCTIPGHKEAGMTGIVVVN